MLPMKSWQLKGFPLGTWYFAAKSRKSSLSKGLSRIRSPSSDRWICAAADEAKRVRGEVENAHRAGLGRQAAVCLVAVAKRQEDH
jgi:hypothetical protein